MRRVVGPPFPQNYSLLSILGRRQRTAHHSLASDFTDPRGYPSLPRLKGRRISSDEKERTRCRNAKSNQIECLVPKRGLEPPLPCEN